MRSLAASAGIALLAGAACAGVPTERRDRGEELYRQCRTCHSLEPGASSPAGPTLHRIVGRAIAGEPGFNYSPALAALRQREERWTVELLDRFLEAPDRIAPGTEMGYPGMAGASDRRVLIDWLRR